MNKNSCGIPAYPNGRKDSRFIVNLDLEGARITFNLIANFISDRDIRNQWFLGVTSLNLNLLFT